MKEHGIRDGELTIADGAIREIIRKYTREAGVRNLERELAKIARKTVTKILMGEAETIKVMPT